MLHRHLITAQVCWAES